MADKIKVDLVTGIARTSYANNLTEPQVGDDGKAKYGCVLILEDADSTAIWQAIVKVANEAYSDPGGMTGEQKLANKIIPHKLHHGSEKPQNPEYAGKWFFSSGTIKPPICVAADGVTPIPAGQIYSGCYVRAQVTVYPYNYKNLKKGIGIAINYLQFVRDGEALAGTPTLDGAVKAFGSAPPLPAQPAPAMPQAPAAPQGFAAPAAPQGFAAPAAPQGFAAPAAPQGFAAPAAPQGFAAPAAPQAPGGFQGYPPQAAPAAPMAPQGYPPSPSVPGYAAPPTPGGYGVPPAPPMPGAPA